MLLLYFIRAPPFSPRIPKNEEGGSVMKQTHEKVIAKLKSLPLKKRRIEQLRYELAHPPTVSETELLSGLSIGGAPLDAVPVSGQISDRTMLIAMRYGDTARRLNHEAKAQIARELRELELETERLEHYISLLDDAQARIIRLHYIAGKTWTDIQSIMDLSEKTLIKRCKSGVDTLAEMYAFIEDLNSN
jgi:DNA-directed RNA polymerase specialized sigma subunit